VAQIVYGAELLARPHDSGSLENLSYAVFVNLVVSLSRAWSLLKGKHLAQRPQPEGGQQAG